MPRYQKIAKEYGITFGETNGKREMYVKSGTPESVVREVWEGYRKSK